jgi:hypothetical protein
MKRLARVVPLLLATVVGCGARTGLRVPDVLTDSPPVDSPRPRPPETCIELAEDAGVITVNLETRPQVSVADVFFIIDRTGSMDGEIDNIKANLQRSIVPAIARAIDDVQFGVATYGDFPPARPTASTTATRAMRPSPSSPPSIAASPTCRAPSTASASRRTAATTPSPSSRPCFKSLRGRATPRGSTPARAAPPRVGSGYGCLRPNAQPIFIARGRRAVAQRPDAHPRVLRAGSFTTPVRCPPSLPSCAATRGPHTYTEALAALQSARAQGDRHQLGHPPLLGPERPGAPRAGHRGRHVDGLAAGV